MKLSRNAVIAEIEDESGQKFSVATRVERIERLGIGVDSYGPIAFTRGALSSWQDSRGIWTMQPDGSGLKKLELVNEITGIPDHAAGSLDGTRIAFGVRQGEADKKQWSLWVQELATASAIQVASFGPGEGPIWQPAWSLDGTQIAFEHGAVFQNGGPVDPRTNREIFVVGVDGSAESIQLTDTLEDSNHPTWSPDGSQIAFARSADKNQGIPYMIMLMNPDGTDSEFVTLGADPSWSPDGKSIAFALWDKTATGPTNIHTIRRDWKQKIVQLTSSPQDDLDPTWSPDGKKILFTRSRTGTGNNEHLWSINADGSDETQLTSSQNDRFWAPDWQAQSSSSLSKYRFVLELTVPAAPAFGPEDNPRWTFKTEITTSRNKR